MSSNSLLHGGTAALAALTTIFTPPNCATSTWLLSTTEAPSEYPPFPTEGPKSCNVPRWEDNIDDGSYDFYSPAVCPSGFVVGPSCTSVQVKTSDDFPKVEAGETVAFCVPSGFSCTADAKDGGVWGMTQTGAAAAVEITVAPAIQIRWRDFDLTLFPTHPLSPGVTIGVGPQPTPSPPPPPPARPTGPAGGNGVVVVSLPTLPRSTLLTSTTGTSAATTLPTSDQNSASEPRIPDDEATSPARSDSSTATTVSSARGSSQAADLSKTSPLESSNSHGLPVGPIILACLISVLIFGTSVFFFCKRRRDRRGGTGPGAQPPLLPVGVGVWVGSSQGSDGRRTKGSKPTAWKTWVTALRNKATRQGYNGLGRVSGRRSPWFQGKPSGARPAGQRERLRGTAEMELGVQDVQHTSLAAGRTGRRRLQVQRHEQQEDDQILPLDHVGRRRSGRRTATQLDRPGGIVAACAGGADAAKTTTCGAHQPPQEPDVDVEAIDCPQCFHCEDRGDGDE
uniref:Uncharacterized protein n=1 Tax=Pyricularia oryzae (strain P131) TaxID=1143193 RepID=L7JJR1_PYRO1